MHVRGACSVLDQQTVLPLSEAVSRIRDTELRLSRGHFDVSDDAYADVGVVLDE
ncbi:hypothetical protein [Nocardia sp. NPDC005998]|uniref:hypothetical protein n=1 Tax=Nocardia sp. NPDC005998 TaxID=3156894 RepID=UPI0033B154EA